ncbi:MAG: ABC transporter ATP-binding protein [Actinomycetaceae bacterium]|nr:ABC transporter ATP-binding protein [Actinomycetaceae bacterium]MDU0969800.1 ABC transporter ATP-binding protein [Actinomycetaceae bacterium]
MTRLAARGITVAYDHHVVLSDVSFTIPPGEFTAIIGPNACGKSTLLRALTRVVPLEGGQILLEDRPIGEYSPKDIARRVGLLPQSPTAPDGISVADLVARGRYPHQSLLRQWSPADEDAVAAAMASAGVTHLAERAVSELSGGQRQRVWIAMILAQDTDLVLLDEPTTYLDISHQIDVLELARALQAAGRTVVAVLHDLNLAFRYATHVAVMHAGRIVAEGAPGEVVSAALIEDVFDLPCRVLPDPESGTPLVIPRLRNPRAAAGDMPRD